MKYPTLKCEEKQNTKVCSIKHKEMKEMRQEGYTYNEIADKFRVTQRTAWMHTAPIELVENSKKQRAKATLKEHNEKYSNDSNYRKKINDSNTFSLNHGFRSDPRFRKSLTKYKHDYNLQQLKKHPTWSSRCSKGGHETTNWSSSCKNKRGKCECDCHKQF